MTAWQAARLTVVQDRDLTPDQAARYSRHTMLEPVGKKGQLKLLDAKVLMIGAGGLGSPAAFYLAAAGVGTIGVVDGDVVDASNLQRQILHTTADVGKSKAESAKETLEALNRDVKVNLYNTRLVADNALEIMKDYDVIVDGADNFPTRYLVNDAAYLLGKPIAHGSIFQFEGQATVLHPKAGGPCYRCLFPEPPPANFAPN